MEAIRRTFKYCEVEIERDEWGVLEIAIPPTIDRIDDIIAASQDILSRYDYSSPGRPPNWVKVAEDVIAMCLDLKEATLQIIREMSSNWLLPAKGYLERAMPVADEIVTTMDTINLDDQFSDEARVLQEARRAFRKKLSG